ncbi:MAG: ABC transporter ATP-binding protein [Cryobacterium sp.]|nr:ABC transporter ATP-binding protein [Oligoflexia bacterium]
MNLKFSDFELTRGDSAFSDFNLEFHAGEITGIIGPNGAGKSTLLKALMGTIPYKGSLKIGNQVLERLTPAQRSRLVTYLGSEIQTDFPLTTLEMVSLGDYALEDASSSEEHLRKIRESMEEVGCWQYRDRLFSELSSGERQRAHFARALSQGPKWILLDESFSRLDLHHQSKLSSLLRTYLGRGYSFVFVSHDLNFTTDVADRCLFLNRGRAVSFGKTSETVTEAAIRDLYPEARFVLFPHPVTGALKVHFRG